MLTQTVIERELEELTIAKARSFVFADNIRRNVVLLDTYWRWYDRLLACSETSWSEADFLEQTFAFHVKHGMPLDEVFRRMITNALSDFDAAGINVAMTDEERGKAYWLNKEMQDEIAWRRKQAKEIEIVHQRFIDDQDEQAA